MGTRKPLRWDGGVNLYADPRALKESQLAYAKNAFPTMEGLLHKRESVRPIGWTSRKTAAGTVQAVQVITLHVPDPITGLDFIVYATTSQGSVLGEFFMAVNMGLEVVGVGAGFPNPPIIAFTAPTIGPASFTNYRGRTIALAAQQEGFYQYVRDVAGWRWVRASFAWAADAASGRPTAQPQTVSVTPRVACSYLGRMVYAHFGPGMGNWLIFADLNSTTHSNATDTPLWALVGPDVLADNGRHLELDSISGEDIIAIREVSLGSITNPLQKALMVLTAQGSCVLCTGAPVQTSDAQFGDANGYLGDFQAAKVNYKCGGTGPGAICDSPYGTFWVGQDDVWCLPQQAPVPIRLGTNIRPALMACPPALRQFVSVTYADSTLYVSVPSPNSASERDIAINHWRLDLYDGLPENTINAQWFGPQDYEGMSEWLTAGQTVTGNPSLCSSLVTRRTDGREVVVGAALAASPNGVLRTFFVSFNEDTRPFDIPFQSPASGRTWVGTDTVTAGEVIRPTYERANGYLYVCATSVLNFNAQTANFTVAQIVTGATSGAKGTLLAQVDAGATGSLMLSNVVGAFLSGEIITDPLGGSASVSGSLSPGVTAGAEPTWPTASGGRVTDGTVVWEEIRGTTFWNRLVNYWSSNSIRHAILMDVKFKDDDWGSPNRNKILRRIDINAYFATRAWSVFRAILNQGNMVGQLGPVPLGDFTLSPTLLGARGDLGSMLLDTSAVAQEFQSKTYRPKLTPIGRSPEGGISIIIADAGIIRARHIQPNFCDMSGIVIDDTNDYITWTVLINGSGIGTIYTTKVTHGLYDNISSLMQEITTLMNSVQGSALTGFTVGANPWSYDNAHVADYPYMNTFTLTFSARDPNSLAVFVFGTAVQLPDEPEATGYSTMGPFYPGRTERLLSILGFDTGDDYVNGTLGSDSWNDGRTIFVVGEQIAPVLASPTRLCGIEVTPYTRPSAIQIGALEIEAAVVPGLPFSNKNR